MKGTLRIYLGAAPGVGKTFAMLSEGHRRASRGADVVIGVVETHAREHTAEQIGDLPVIPRRRVDYRDTTLEEMDVDAILTRGPDIVLVDEFAHTNAPGSRHEKRWQDVEELLDAGIDVISTVNIQHLESLNDVVARITGVTQRETVPDALVRAADQIELVDMSPEALRRRMAHGNIYSAERIDAALGNYFRPGNLGALRELALLWVAGRVEESLNSYLDQHAITETWETRERVVVGLTGAPGGDRLIRRAARIAGRVGGDLLGLHVAAGDGLAERAGPDLAAQQRLVRELGGTVHEVVGNSRADALVAFATGEKATQLVLGASRRSRWYELRHGSLFADVSRRAAGVDIHVIATDESGEADPDRSARRSPPITHKRLVAAWVMLGVGIVVLTAVLVSLRDDIQLSTAFLLYLVLVVIVAALGGTLVAAVAAVASSLAVNLVLVPPYHTLTISDPENVVALAVFVIVALVVGVLVHVAARRGAEATVARAEAEALARSAAELAADPDPLPRLMDQLRTTFGLAGVQIRSSADVVASSGHVDGAPTVVLPLRAGDADWRDHRLELFGGRTTADDQRVLRVLADQLAVALETERLARDAAEAGALAEVDAVRTALLRAVSHDLRTPLASIKAMVSGLRDPGVDWTADQLAEGLATIDSETDRLNRLVGNLLDAGRLQTGALAVERRPTDVADTVGSAVESLALTGSIDVDIDADLPLVDADPALLERTVANLVSNSARFSARPGSIRVDAEVVGSNILLRVVDRGPGIPVEEHATVLSPFHRLGDQSATSGVGLGMSIVQGFVTAMGASMTLDDTPGGGLTVTITLRPA